MMSRHSNFQRGGALRRSQHKHFVENAGQWVANIYVNGLAANQMEVFVDRGDVVVRSKECVQKPSKSFQHQSKSFPTQWILKVFGIFRKMHFTCFRGAWRAMAKINL